MSKQALLPSPNRFLLSLADCSPDGTFAYGARNSLVLLHSVTFSEGCAPAPKFSLIPNAHRDKHKVTAVAFSNRSLNEGLGNYFLASTGDDGAVAIWDTNALELVRKHAHHVNSY
jgi:WD40 repeat protein